MASRTRSTLLRLFAVSSKAKGEGEYTSVVSLSDPERPTAGGITSVVLDMLRFDPGPRRLIGVTADRNVRLGEWRRVEVSDTPIQFLPVARVDRARFGFARKIVPDSLKLALGIFRFRRVINLSKVEVHDVHIAAAIRPLLVRGSYRQYVHCNAQGAVSTSSDRRFKGIPKLYFALERIALERAREVVLFSAAEAPRVRALCRRVVVSTTWYDEDVFGLNPRQSPTDRMNVIWVGRLELGKDPELALRTFAAVREIRDCRLHVVGEGRLYKQVAELAIALGVEEDVVMHGCVSRSEVASLMRAADVMLMTSHSEASPVVLSEALACGTPVVATVESDPEGVLISGVNGFRVDSREPADLADAVNVAVTSCSAVECAESVAHRRSSKVVPDLIEFGAWS